MNLNNIQFYKPNASNKGVAVSVSFNPADSGIYVSFIKQFSWDAAKRIGSFKGNKDNPKAKKNIKFNDIEVAGIIRAIEKEEKYLSSIKIEINKEKLSLFEIKELSLKELENLDRLKNASLELEKFIKEESSVRIRYLEQKEKYFNLLN